MVEKKLMSGGSAKAPDMVLLGMPEDASEQPLIQEMKGTRQKKAYTKKTTRKLQRLAKKSHHS